ncbi:Uncharacterised protein [Legionella beliardensis]|uniref:Uncharacterized protein n=1 Tax=Legionella beliardensis TaxID=91822 RepID=A0A378HZH9_9GAMM|nr:hypothetical protein [Legionella beliardensis]STX27785.1 Uncharacterised protein [Legionella beliardensis]
MFSKMNIDSTVKNIHQQIKDYNKQSDPSNAIKFVHGSSSAIFAFIGKEVTVQQKNRESVNKVIPNALIPTGFLRKSYGVYPVSGELEIGAFSYGSRKCALNYHYLSGVKPTYQGLLAAYNSAKLSNRVPSEETIHETIATTIKCIDKYLYLRSLKMLLMHMTNLMLISKNKQEAELFANRCIHLLKNKYQQLKLENPDNQAMDKSFNKYILKLEDIIFGGALSFAGDDTFINHIKNQYPLLLCSHVTPLDFTDGVPDEQIYYGELNLNNIDLIFTPAKHIDDLKGKLEKAGLNAIKVMSFESSSTLEKASENSSAFCIA